MATLKAAATIHVNTESETDSTAAAAAMEQAGAPDAALALPSEICGTTLNDDEVSDENDEDDAGDSQPDATRENVDDDGESVFEEHVRNCLAFVSPLFRGRHEAKNVLKDGRKQISEVLMLRNVLLL